MLPIYTKEQYAYMRKIQIKEQKEYFKLYGNRERSKHEDIEKMCTSCGSFGGYIYPITKQIPVCANHGKKIGIIDQCFIGWPMIYKVNPFTDCQHYKKHMGNILLYNTTIGKILRSIKQIIG